MRDYCPRHDGRFYNSKPDSWDFSLSSNRFAAVRHIRIYLHPRPLRSCVRTRGIVVLSRITVGPYPLEKTTARRR